MDGVRNGDEVVADCGGAFCRNSCLNGAPCTGDVDCRSDLCVSNICLGIADTCQNPTVLSSGVNNVAWVATVNDYLTTRPACTSADVAGPDIVLSYTATLDGVLTYRLNRPDTSTRWVVVVSSAPCGTLTPELRCTSDVGATTMQGEIAVTAGTTYYFYVADTNQGAYPLSAPLTVTINEVVPACMPGQGGVVGTTTARLPTGITSISENFVVPDEDPFGFVYIGGPLSLYRVPKVGGALENVMAMASLNSGTLGYELVIAGNEVFTIDDGLISTTNRVWRISNDGGASFVPGGVNYATFPTMPLDDFRGAAAIGGTMYLITQETTTAEPTEIWSIPIGATSLPVTATRRGTIMQQNCTGLAADASYLYTVCASSSQLVRIDRTTLAIDTVAVGVSPSTERNAIIAHDPDADGTADALYFQVATESAYYGCGLWTPNALTATLVSWGGGTLNFGLGLDRANNTLYAYDDDTNELIIIQ
jgi:hypothetical protein